MGYVVDDIVGTVESEGGVNLFDKVQSTKVATGSQKGLMSADDKAKLDGIEMGANKYVHPASGVVAGAYVQVTVDENGHVTAGKASPNGTLEEHGITDAYIADGSVHLGANEITPLTADSTLSADRLTGVIDVANLPHDFPAKSLIVPDEASRFALTEADVKKGDIVKQVDTAELFMVIDTTKLDSSAGYLQYSGTSIDWGNVIDKPFEKVGEGLLVEDRKLVSRPDWEHLSEKPFKSIGTGLQVSSKGILSIKSDDGIWKYDDDGNIVVGMTFEENLAGKDDIDAMFPNGF